MGTTGRVWSRDGRLLASGAVQLVCAPGPARPPRRGAAATLKPPPRPLDARPEPRQLAGLAEHGLAQRRVETRGIAAALAALAALGLSACGTPAPPPADPDPAVDAAVQRRADAARAQHLEREVERLRTDLAEAEQALVALESNVRANHSRAEAVSATAEARVLVRRARPRAPWRAADCDAAEAKLADAERMIEEGKLSAAMFFASRARRIAEDVIADAGRVEGEPSARFVKGERVNLRAGPSTADAVVGLLAHDTPVFVERRAGEWELVRTAHGQAGWVHARLLRARRAQSDGSPATITQSFPAALAR